MTDNLEARRIRRLIETAHQAVRKSEKGTSEHGHHYHMLNTLLDEYAPVLDAGGKLWRREDTTTVLRAVAYAEKGSP